MNNALLVQGLDLSPTASALNQAITRAPEQKLRNRLLETQANQMDESAMLTDMATDALMMKPALESGNIQEAIAMANSRIEKIKQRGGDPSHTMRFLDALSTGKITPQQASLELDSVINAARQRGLLGGGVNGQQGARIGQYNPGDYTPESWSQFVKNPSDPSVLKRYETSAKERLYNDQSLADRAAQVEGNIAGAKSGAQEQAKSDVQLEMKPKIEREVTKARKEVEALVAKQTTEQANLNKISDAKNAYDFLSTRDLSKIYGRGESMYPELLRSQEGIDMIAKRDQLIGMLKLGARGELKGQGPITEGEQAILGEAITVLGNANISHGIAKAALDDAMGIIYRNAGQQFEGGGAGVPNIEDLVNKYAD